MLLHACRVCSLPCPTAQAAGRTATWSLSSSVSALSSCVRSLSSMSTTRAPSRTVSLRSSPPEPSRARLIRFCSRFHCRRPSWKSTCRKNQAQEQCSHCMDCLAEVEPSRARLIRFCSRFHCRRPSWKSTCRRQGLGQEPPPSSLCVIAAERRIHHIAVIMQLCSPPADCLQPAQHQQFSVSFSEEQP